MKYLKALGLLAAISAAMLAWAAGATATTITSPTGTPYTGAISATSEGHLALKTFANIECHSSVSGESLTHGSGQTAKIALTSLLFGTSGNLNGVCTNSWHVTTEKAGELEIHWIAEHEATVTSTGATVHSTRFNVDCYYGTNETHIGTLTDSHRTGSTASPSTATLHVDVALPIEPTSDALCGSGNAEMEGSYQITSPDALFVDEGDAPPGTTITSPEGTPYTGEMHATSEGHLTLKTFVNIQCHSSISGESLTHGEGQTAKGAITSLLWGTSGNLNGTCTNSWHVTTEQPGELETHWTAEHEGTVTSTGATVHATRFGVDCYYETEETHIGTLTDSHKTGTTESPGTATLHVKASIPIEPTSDALCGSGNAAWEGSYEIITPDRLYIDE